MKKPTAVPLRPPLSFLSLLHLLLFFSPPVHSADIIDKICTATPFVDLCESSLRPLSPPDTTATDPKSLASAMATVVLGNMTETLNYFEFLIKHSRDPAEERALAECAELYRPVVRFNIPQAINAMRRGEFGFAAYVLADAEKQAEACDKGFSSNSSPVTERNKLVKNLCDVAIAIIKLLPQGG